MNRRIFDSFSFSFTMDKRTRSLFLAIWLCGASLLGAVQALSLYKLIFQDMMVFSPCEEYPENFLTEFLDYSNTTFEYLPNNNMHINGTIVVRKELPKSPPIKANARVFKKVRGQWKDTIYSLKRDDFCRAFFSPLEMWYNYTSQAPIEYRTCDIHTGGVSMDFVLDVVLPIPDRNAAGDYKLEVKAIKGNQFLCTNIYFTAERL